MAYEIKHKSQNACLIKYVIDDKSGRKNWIEIPLIIFGILALLIGTDLTIIIAGLIIGAFILNGLRPRKTAFEIELNRAKNRIFVKNAEQAAPITMTYPLNSLTGLGFQELSDLGSAKKGVPVELIFRFDDDIEGSFITSKNSLLSEATQAIEPDGEIFWDVPVQKIHHPASLSSAKKIIAAVDKWLGLETVGKIENAEEEVEIIRDFRELEKGDTDTKPNTKQ